MSSLAPPSADPSSTMLRHFQARAIDDTPSLLEQSYRLRYRVYCLERKFLQPEDYPTEMEIDAFDAQSVHVGAVDRAGELAGTARVVRNTMAGLPLFRYVTILPHEAALRHAPTVVEVSRLSVSRRYRSREGDGFYGFEEEPDAAPTAPSRNRRRVQGEVFLTLLKACYQASKRMGATHWLAATEKSLQRMLARYGFPARLVGPESDYFGLVAPYSMSLPEFDQVILTHRFPELDDFVVGLETQFLPAA